MPNTQYSCSPGPTKGKQKHVSYPKLTNCKQLNYFIAGQQNDSLIYIGLIITMAKQQLSYLSSSHSKTVV